MVSGYSRDDIVTPAQAARALQMREDDAVAWLRARHLICDIGGRARVVWGDVLEAARATARPKVHATPRATVPLDAELTPLRGKRRVQEAP